eukprot:CAMPEP_0172449726 /NCGR_PEP_ID=MMETSP1065-20121228/8349_1 /TAXON_ID=265537 /ORGANISM="Amphiprora paludosa, Strain CCMP125" /LENGTH=990 /DNA_ID=CAMNT_0013201453 /DNA_START=35 /DNA_END=3007 /DNA_ORIENTATION=-
MTQRSNPVLRIEAARQWEGSPGHLVVYRVHRSKDDPKVTLDLGLQIQMMMQDQESYQSHAFRQSCHAIYVNAFEEADCDGTLVQKCWTDEELDRLFDHQETLQYPQSEPVANGGETVLRTPFELPYGTVWTLTWHAQMREPDSGRLITTRHTRRIRRDVTEGSIQKARQALPIWRHVAQSTAAQLQGVLSSYAARRHKTPTGSQAERVQVWERQSSQLHRAMGAAQQSLHKLWAVRDILDQTDAHESCPQVIKIKSLLAEAVEPRSELDVLLQAHQKRDTLRQFSRQVAEQIEGGTLTEWLQSVKVTEISQYDGTGSACNRLFQVLVDHKHKDALYLDASALEVAAQRTDLFRAKQCQVLQERATHVASQQEAALERLCQQERDQQAQQEERARLQARYASMPGPVGCAVELQGLQKHSGWNGKQGVLLGPYWVQPGKEEDDPEGEEERFRIQVMDESTKNKNQGSNTPETELVVALKIENFKVLQEKTSDEVETSDKVIDLKACMNKENNGSSWDPSSVRVVKPRARQPKVIPQVPQRPKRTRECTWIHISHLDKFMGRQGKAAQALQRETKSRLRVERGRYEFKDGCWAPVSVKADGPERVAAVMDLIEERFPYPPPRRVAVPERTKNAPAHCLNLGDALSPKVAPQAKAKGSVWGDRATSSSSPLPTAGTFPPLAPKGTMTSRPPPVEPCSPPNLVPAKENPFGLAHTQGAFSSVPSIPPGYREAVTQPVPPPTSSTDAFPLEKLNQEPRPRTTKKTSILATSNETRAPPQVVDESLNSSSSSFERTSPAGVASFGLNSLDSAWSKWPASPLPEKDAIGVFPTIPDSITTSQKEAESSTPFTTALEAFLSPNLLQGLLPPIGQNSFSTSQGGFLFQMTLSEFLEKNQSCLKIPSLLFGEWLQSLDVFSLEDLLEAVNDDEFLDEMQENGLKGFKRSSFKKLVASAIAENQKYPSDDHGLFSDKEPVELFSPIAQELKDLMVVSDVLN